jgi:16S rRNA (guanine(966)-N(2))-methyltransferase RsmD
MSSGKVRVIGGAWRGRSIKVADVLGLRPTADRTRETLFNCLGQRVDGLTCLDMFAGTGALGFESLSRGAKLVYMIEQSPKAHQLIKENYQLLSQDGVLGELNLMRGDAIHQVANLIDESVDITFIDPPFSQEDLYLKALAQAVRINRKTSGSAIYVEHPKNVVIEQLLKEISKNADLWEIRRTIRSGMAIGSLLAPKAI